MMDSKYDYQTKATPYQLKDYDKEGTVVIMVNPFQVKDTQGDISMPGSFVKTIKDGFHRLRYLFNHSTILKLGEPIEGWEDEGFVVKAALNLGKDIGRNTYEDYKLAGEYGRSVEHSMGAYAIKTDGKPLRREDPLKDPRRVYEWFVKEFSYIPGWGANSLTGVLEMKSEDDVAFLDYCIKEGDYTDCKFKQLEALRKQAESTSHISAAEAIFFNTLNF